MRRTTCIVLALLCLASTANAKVIWKYDDGPDDLGSLAGTKMHPQFGHPGFVAGEAFGVLFRPKPSDYPIEISSVELIMAASAAAKSPMDVKINAAIEIWNDASDASAPTSTKPLWSVTTQDFFNPLTGKPGTPIQGNTVMVYEFTGTKPGDKPPAITKGNIRIIVRILSKSQDLSTYWGKTDCAMVSIAGIDIGCGCQELAMLADTQTTPKTQLMHIVWPLGTCSGGKQWRFVEDLNNGIFQMKGDFRLRMGVKGTGGGTTADAGSTDAGGTDAGGTADTGVADTGPADTGPADTGPADTGPPPKPVISLVTPAVVSADKPTEIEVIGENFQTGAVVKVGASKTSVTKVTPLKITTMVLPGLTPGEYAVVVENPNGQVGFKDKAVEVKAAPTADVAIDAGIDAGTVNRGQLALDLVDPRCVSSKATTEVTIFGGGFAEGITLQAGGKKLVGIEVLSPTKLTAVVPSGLAFGKQGLVAELGGASDTLADALEVDCAPTGVKDSGCSAAPSPHQGGGMLLLLLITALVAVLRRVTTPRQTQL
ncbi:MAG: IPT/TIG domain-containing protein [Myxococcales bacterium]|nr:IPT/TIG domain-containing protein [Myxococcales bacterium]